MCAYTDNDSTVWRVDNGEEPSPPLLLLDKFVSGLFTGALD